VSDRADQVEAHRAGLDPENPGWLCIDRLFVAGHEDLRTVGEDGRCHQGSAASVYRERDALARAYSQVVNEAVPAGKTVPVDRDYAVPSPKPCKLRRRFPVGKVVKRDLVVGRRDGDEIADIARADEQDDQHYECQ
jgi:hypothetical protein